MVELLEKREEVLAKFPKKRKITLWVNALCKKRMFSLKKIQQRIPWCDISRTREKDITLKQKNKSVFKFNLISRRVII